MSRLRELREKSGKTMKDVAEGMGFPYTTYVNYEKGVRDPNTDALKIMAKYFGVTINYLLGEDVVPEEEIDMELNNYLELLRTRPELKVLLDTVKGASKAEVEANVQFIEALRKGKE